MENSTLSGNKRVASALAFLLAGVAVVATVGYTLHTVSADSNKKIYATVNGTTVVDGVTLKHAFITEGVWGDPISAGHPASDAHPNWPSYGPSTHMVLPANSLVTMTLHVYDSGEKLNHNYFARVVGTTSNQFSIDGGAPVSSILPTEVEHTFTIHGVPTATQDPMFVNIPLPRVVNDDKGNPIATNDPGTKNQGHTVVFSFVTPKSGGEYVWNCEYPCGDGTYAKFGAVMGSVGYMSGKISVING